MSPLKIVSKNLIGKKTTDPLKKKKKNYDDNYLVKKIVFMINIYLLKNKVFYHDFIIIEKIESFAEKYLSIHKNYEYQHVTIYF